MVRIARECGRARPRARARGGRAHTWAFAILALFAATAEAHLIVDMKMSVRAPGFIAAGQQLTYEVVADDLANDNALGLVVTDTLPSGAAFVSVTAPGWNCGQSKGVITCSAEQLGPGEHVITIKAAAPAQSGPITNKAHITSLGSFDPAADNDDATNSVMVYTPSRCTAPAPVLLTPADNTSSDQTPQFSWMPSATGATYVVRASVEGAAVREVARTTETSAGPPLDRGSAAWWVEATFTDCPPIASEHRRVTINRAPAFKTTAVKSGLTSPSGLAFGPNGELYVTDEDDSVVLLVRLGEATTIAGAAGQYGAANGQFARFNHPTGITVTPLDGFVYVTDSSNGSVRVLYTGGPFVPAFDIAGAAFSHPVAVAATFRGSLYVADLDGNMVRLMTPVPGTTGIFTTTDVASFSAPGGLAVAADGTLYVAEQGTGNIRKRAPSGDSSILASGFQRAGALALDPFGNLYVCDRGTHLLQKVAPSGLVTTIATFGDPAGVAVAADLSVYVADKGNHAVRKVEIDTAPAQPEPAVSRRRSVGH